jgi:parallel beta helix pectate lyase-like protein
MKNSVLAFIGAICLALVSMPANAQATRTWISGVGDDANPCSRTAPCKTFAGAISKTAPAGEINCLDPGGFGALTITMAITISCGQAGDAGVLVSGTNGIVVSAGATDKVVLKGLDFEGLGSGLNGVQVNSGLAVYILNCDIRHFTGNGVNVTSSTAGTRVFVSDSFIENNAGGVNVQGASVSNSVSISNTLIDGNTSFAVQATGTGNAVALVRSILSGSPVGLNLMSGANGDFFGPSNIVTGTINGTPASIAYK